VAFAAFLLQTQPLEPGHGGASSREQPLRLPGSGVRQKKKSYGARRPQQFRPASWIGLWHGESETIHALRHTIRSKTGLHSRSVNQCLWRLRRRSQFRFAQTQSFSAGRSEHPPKPMDSALLKRYCVKGITEWNR